MYKYDEYDQQMVDTRVAEFRDQVRRRLSGELTEDQFRPLRAFGCDLAQISAKQIFADVGAYGGS